MQLRPFAKAYTLAEMVLTLGLIGVVGLGLLMFTTTAARHAARNLATNHSHDALRISNETLVSELRNSGTSFRLMDYNGTTFTDATPSPTSDVDLQTGEFISSRANGVRFRKFVGGPCRLATSCAATATTLTFDFRTGTSSTYNPQVGDKLVIPLISREFDITAVSGTPSAAAPNATITLSAPVGYTLSTTGTNLVMGRFYRRVAFVVWNNELRFHDNFNGSTQANYTVIRSGITSPRPFSLLYASSTSSVTDALRVRVSMEFTDLGYSNRNIGNGTTVLRTVIPARNQPTDVASTN